MADGRVGTLLGLALPVVAFVAFNIGLPAFRQLQQRADKATEPTPKKGGKRRAVVAGLTGLSAAALAAAPESADAAQARALACAASLSRFELYTCAAICACSASAQPESL